MKAIGVKAFLGKTFNVYEFEGRWMESFGEPEKNFLMVIYGASGNGKTEFAIQLTKYLAKFSKVLYCSYEQGISKSLQDSLNRNNMEDVDGSVYFTKGEPILDLISRLKKRQSPRIVIIDSLDYMRLTTDQFKLLRKQFPQKSFIIICWSKNDKPKSQYAQDIEYMADIKVPVRKFKAFPASRFGGNQPFVIWEKKPKSGEQLSFLQHENYS